MNINDFLFSNRVSSFSQDAYLDLTDITFMEMVNYIQDTYAYMAQSRDKLRRVNAKKKAQNDYMNALSDYMGKSSAKDPEDTIWIPGGVDNPIDPSKIPDAWRTGVEGQLKGDDNKLIIEGDQLKLRYAKFLTEYAEGLGEDVCKVTYEPDKNNPTKIVIEIQGYSNRINFGLYKQKEITNRLNQAQREFDNLNVNSQLLMIDFQRFMNDFNQKLQLVSNTEAKDDRTKNVIIGNFK